VRGPIGVAIDAETPGEIAVSVAAELVAVRRGATLARSAKAPEASGELASTPAKNPASP
jgi:xanthine/CO dehydrogenase XdhC/CoxF family maturation factor